MFLCIFLKYFASDVSVPGNMCTNTGLFVIEFGALERGISHFSVFYKWERTDQHTGHALIFKPNL